MRWSVVLQTSVETEGPELWEAIARAESLCARLPWPAYYRVVTPTEEPTRRSEP